MFSKEKQLIQTFLTNFLEREQKNFAQHPWSNDVFQRLETFLSQGKMIRGSLVLFSFSLFEDTGSEHVVPLAAAIELIHAGFLIHDDIMDQDMIRRGNPSLFVQYQKMCPSESKEVKRHFGQSMATCVGDILFFLGQRLLREARISSLQKEKIIDLCSQEFIAVGFAQMQDMFHGTVSAGITEDAILHVYRYKTGRYTFSLPLMIGAIAADQQNSVIKKFEKIGEDLGILFQLKDDEIGLFSTVEEIGKSVGSDIRENKKTLYWYYIFLYASEEDKERLQKIFGYPDISHSDIAFVHTCIEKYGVIEKIAERENILKNNIEKTIEDAPFSKEKKQLLFSLLLYSFQRKK